MGWLLLLLLLFLLLLLLFGWLVWFGFGWFLSLLLLLLIFFETTFPPSPSLVEIFFMTKKYSVKTLVLMLISEERTWVPYI